MNNTQKTVLIVGTCDSKGEEILFMRDVVESKGLKCLVLDIGLLADPKFKADISRQQLSEAVGSSLEELIDLAKKGRYEMAVEKLGSASEVFVRKMYKEGTIDGILAIGGSMGTALGLRALRVLPVGFPKVLISTVAISEFLHPYFVKSDLTLIQPVSDFVGVNQWTKRDLKKAALTICAMVLEDEPMEPGNWIGMPAIGWSSHAANTVKKFLEKHGYKVAAAHSVSMQCGILEQLIRQDVIKGMVDLCHFEILHEIAGAACSSQDRLTAGVEKGIPMILAPSTMVAVAMSTLDMPKFMEKGRVAFAHNEILGTAAVSNEEMVKTAEIICSRLNKSQGKVAYVVPKQGFCAYDNEGKPYYNPEGRAAFIDVLKNNLNPMIQLEILDCHWDDSKFEDRICELSLEYFSEIK